MRFGDFWKISVLAVWINLAPPVVCFAEGPAGAAYIAGSDRGVWAVNEFGWIAVLERGTRAYPGAGKVYITDFSLSTIYAEDITWVQANFNTGGVSLTGWTSPLAHSYTAAGEYLDSTFLGNAPDGTPLVREMIEFDKFWDIDKDGDVDTQDIVLFATDMDNDGIPNEWDDDADGDGEVNYAEQQEPESATEHTRKKFDPRRFPDRDGDTLPDLLDKDGDGVMNWIENIRETDPNDAESKPSNDSAWIDFVDAEGNVLVSGAVTHTTSWVDSDGDGAWDWIETLFETNPNDPQDYYDADVNGYFDWKWPLNEGGGSAFVGTPVDPPDPDPDPPPPPPPFSPPPSTVITPGISSGGTLTGPSSGNNPNQMFVDNSDNTQTNNIGANNFQYVDGEGNPYNPALPPGVGGSGTTQGDGDYLVIDIPKGKSTNYQGVGGGTWKQRSSPDRESALEEAAEGISEGLEGLAPVFGGSTNGAYGTLSHSMTFTLTLPGLGEETFTIPTLPDPSTWYGATLETMRQLLIVVAKVVSSWVCFNAIWRALRQSF